jgi:hypothetical protein
MLPLGLQMNGNARHSARNPLAFGRLQLHRLRGVEFIEKREIAALRQPLQRQVSFRRNAAHHKAGLVDGRGNQAFGRARANRDRDVAEVVDLDRR